jgi:SAM-dependent methyltransferase
VAEIDYQGGELELFAHATNWKSYYGRLLQPFIKGRVLEVGAGIGGTMPFLWNDSVSSWLCLEPDPALSLELSDRIGSFKRGKVDSKVGTIDDIPLTQRFDAILYIDVLEHIKADRAELGRAAQHLADGGRIIVLSPAFQSLFSPFDSALGHERRYTAKSLAAVVPRGLKQEKLFYADSVGAMLSFSNRLLLKKSMPSENQIRFWDKVIIPISRIVDPVTRSRFGRSVIAVFRK